ncbi:hypothetical protein BKA69DRAFT_1037745 [Paraphysoderma sedebokerense]|nr:hypothetical protein BKA69DRAFT_1037745 [Paraphysoderma sedebokerense]
MPPRVQKPTADNCVNARFVAYIQEKLDQTRSDSNYVFTLRKAKQALIQHTEPLANGNEAQKLKGIGPTLSKYLQDRFLQDGGNPNPPDTGSWPSFPVSFPPPASAPPRPQPPAPASMNEPAKRKRQPKAKTADSESSNPANPASAGSSAAEPKKKRQRKDRVYVPAFRSGAYAILITLYKESLKPGFPGYMLKSDIQKKAQPFCDSSLTEPEKNQYYSAWNSMSTLCNKDLVIKQGNPGRYYLTDEGKELAKKCYEQGNSIAAQTLWGDQQSNDLIRNFRRSIGGDKLDDSDHEIQMVATSSQGTGGPNTARKDSTHSYTTSASRPGASSTTFEKETRFDQFLSSSSSQSFSLDDEYSSTLSQSISRTSAKSKSSANFQTSSYTSTTGTRTTTTASQSFESYASQPHSSASFSHSFQSRSDSLNSVATSSSVTTSSKLQLLPPPSSALKSEIPTFSPASVRTLPPGFEIILILDNREIKNRDSRYYFQEKLMNRNVKVETRKLEVGDFIWIARRACGTGNMNGNEDEIVLDYIVERKCLDDLVSSIKDNRFKEQKFRLSNTGLSHLIYVVEDDNQNRALLEPIWAKSVQTAHTQTQIWNNFFVKRTSSVDDTIEYLIRLTETIKSQWRNKPLYYLTPPDKETWIKYKRYGKVINNAVVPMSLEEYETRKVHEGALKSCVDSVHFTFAYVEMLNTKTKAFTLNDVFVKMLMTVRGVSAEKAKFLAEKYKTPRALFETYASLPTQQSQNQLLKQDSEAEERRLGMSLLRKKFGDALSRKVAEIWCSNEYNDGGVQSL